MSGQLRSRCHFVPSTPPVPPSLSLLLPWHHPSTHPVHPLSQATAPTPAQTPTCLLLLAARLADPACLPATWGCSRYHTGYRGTVRYIGTQYVHTIIPGACLGPLSSRAHCAGLVPSPAHHILSYPILPQHTRNKARRGGFNHPGDFSSLCWG